MTLVSMDTFYLALLALGAVGSLVFVVDYLRTANLDLPYTRLMITMNSAISGVLWLLVLIRLGVIGATDAWRYIYFAFFIIIDVTIWYQLVLLRRMRKADKSTFKDRLLKKKRDKKERDRLFNDENNLSQ